MYPGGGLIWTGVLGLAWLVGLTIFVWRQDIFLRKLFPENRKNGESLRDRLNEVLGKIGELDEFREKNLGNISKAALKRYNPYRDMGGDQSFSAAFLDGRGDGVVVTSLHSRAGTRVFAKPVARGKEVAVRFSKEEEDVVTEAAQGK